MRSRLDRRTLFGLGGTAAAATVALMLTRQADAAAPTDAQWRARLGPERYRILRQAGTERPYSSPLLKEKRKGVFACAGCGLPLFSSATKYDSGTGWPSFWRALPKAVGYKRDNSLFMVRTEEHCARCGGHLGHVFDDGPPPTGKRHCINGLSLTFKPVLS